MADALVRPPAARRKPPGPSGSPATGTGRERTPQTGPFPGVEVSRPTSPVTAGPNSMRGSARGRRSRYRNVTRIDVDTPDWHATLEA